MFNTSISALADQEIKRVRKDPGCALVIHYSCITFSHASVIPLPPRITAIAVRNLSDNKVTSFSISQTAEKANLRSRGKIRKKIDELEYSMLEDFFQFAFCNQSKLWVHWRMRDETYGFQALKNRYEAIGGNISNIPDFAQQLDLKEILANKYGTHLSAPGILKKLAKWNDFHFQNFIDGLEEGRLAEKNDYPKLAPSVLEKTELIRSLLRKEIDGKIAIGKERLGIRTSLTRIAGVVAAILGIWATVLTIADSKTGKEWSSVVWTKLTSIPLKQHVDIPVPTEKKGPSIDVPAPTAH